MHGAGREQQASQGVLDAVAHGGLVLTLLGGSAVSLFAVVCLCVCARELFLLLDSFACLFHAPSSHPLGKQRHLALFCCVP